MEILILWICLSYLLWFALLLIFEGSPQVLEVRTFPDTESHASSSASPQEEQGENLQGQHG